MKTFAIVLFIGFLAGSSALAQTEATADTISILVEVWVADNLSSIIIAAAGHEDSCAVSGTGRFVWRVNSKGSIAFLFPLYNEQAGRFLQKYLPGFDCRRFPVFCLVQANPDSVCSIYPLEFTLFGRDRIRWRSEKAVYIYSRFYLDGKGVEIFDFSDNLQAERKEEDY